MARLCRRGTLARKYSGVSAVGPTLVLASATFTGTAKFGSGALDGGSGSVAVVAASASRTIECWVKGTSAPGSAAGVFTSNDSASGLYFNGSIAPSMWLGGGFSKGSVTTVLDSAWHHVAIVYDSVAVLTRMFIDGVFDCQDNYIAPPANPVMVVTGGYAVGIVVDEAAIFTGVKYPGTTTFTPPIAAYTSAAANLVAAWHLDGDGISA